MLAVKLNLANYEYDVHSLVKAFYPEETVKVLTPETKEETAEAVLEEAGSALLEIVLTEEGANITCAGNLHEWNYADADVRFKDGFKKFLYRVLCKETAKELPWGNLTGIRPTKIAYGMLEEGKTDEEISEFLKEAHYVSDEKIDLSIDIAKRERELLSDIHYEGGYSLYIGIPFCPTTCLYCSFTSYPIAGYRKLVEDYVDCVIKEMDYVSKKYAHKILDSVYIGGGTPTTLEAEQLDRLITALKEKFNFSTVKEFTVEAGRADSITREKLEVIKKHQVDRISINPQTMKQETLQIIGRRHTVEQVVEAYRLAREIGFENINMDLILGLPGELEEDVQNTIDRVVELAPDSLTVHSLAIKRASKLSQWIVENGVKTLRNTDETMKIAAAGAKKLGMDPYYLYRQKNMSGNFENVGYAKPGKYGLYNILIMEEKQTIVALGAGSISKVVLPDGRIERSDNVKDVALYIEKIDEMLDRKEKLFGLEKV
ncbi:MAG: coproporphyrinogen dehydrogenase HemZ [Lachnospiraceae bacterium]|nr:coproporphyrinogen dehydrogenase HemZ [Lachnospiraceae bacterium]